MPANGRTSIRRIAQPWKQLVPPLPPGELDWCGSSDYAGIYEFFAHPDTARELIGTGMWIDGRHATVKKVDEYPHGWQCRATVPLTDRDPGDEYDWAA